MRIEWKVPQGRTIVQATANTRQVVVALSGGDLLYFELDDVGQLVEVGKKELGSEVVCLDIAPIPEGRQRARFLGIFIYLFFVSLNLLLICFIFYLCSHYFPSKKKKKKKKKKNSCWRQQ